MSISSTVEMSRCLLGIHTAVHLSFDPYALLSINILIPVWTVAIIVTDVKCTH